MNGIFTLRFWKDALERAVTTGAQFIIGGVGFSDAGPVNAFELDWMLIGGFAVGGVAISMLTSLAAATAGRRPR